MLRGTRIFVGPELRERDRLVDLAEALGGEVVACMEQADLAVVPERPEPLPEGLQVLIPAVDPLEAFYLFCLCKKHCFSA